MSKLTKQKLIISLIKDHLINVKLINGLNAIGLNADEYSLNLGQTIFDLMGFKDDKPSDAVFEYYLLLIQKVNKINITKQPRHLEKLADNIHSKLELKRLEK